MNESSVIIPSCRITVDGRPVVVRPHSAADTVADLAEALGLDRSAQLWLDGVHVEPETTLKRAGLRVGSSVVTSEPAADGAAADHGASVRVAVVAGPACRGARRLGVGRHRVGRGPDAELSLDDPDIEPHHGVLDVAADGSVAFTQLTGRVPARIEARSTLTELRLGSSRVVIDASDSLPTNPTTRPAGLDGTVVVAEGDPWRRVVRRGRGPDLPHDPPRIVAPEPLRDVNGPPLIGLVGAGVAAAGAGLMAALIGQPLFALFGAIGALAAVATWAAGMLGTRRDRRRSSTTRANQVEKFATALAQARTAADRRHRHANPALVDVLGDLAHGDRCWQRRIAIDAPLRITLGIGGDRWEAPIDDRSTLDAELMMAVERAELLADVAVPLDLPGGRVVALRGTLDVATSLARAVVVQLATLVGPADWRLLVVTNRVDEWSWANWLPHAVTGSTVVRRPDDGLGDIGVDERQQLVVITDDPAALASRTGSLRRLLDATRATAIVVSPQESTVPTVCTAVFELGAHGLGRWRDRPESCLHVAGLARADADAAARRLAPLLDPEDADAGAGSVPAMLRLGDVVERFDPAGIVETWRRQGPDPAPAATIGRSGDGSVEIDLVRDGPHALIAGTTGAGKSELLRTLVVALAAQVGPDHLSFVLVDFKGGATFDECARLPHCVGLVTDLDGGLAERAIVSLDAEITRRERLLRDVRADDLTTYRRNATEALPRLVVVVDEFATLAKELPDVLTALVGIAQRGRSLGVHLVLATQRPAGMVTDDIRANTNLRLALRVHDRSDATDVVGDERPASIARTLPGRAVLRLGPEELVTFQTASCTGPFRARGDRLLIDADESDLSGEPGASSELSTLVSAVGAAAELAAIPSPRRPWLDPLPERLERSVLAEHVGRCDATVGVVDDPATQSLRPLQWRRGSGNLLIVGSIGSGTTTTAMTVVAARLRMREPEQAHLYVIDGRGDSALDAFAEVAQCGAVVRATEVERLDRLLRHLVADLDQRTLDGDGRPDVIVLVDGVESVRAALSTVERTESAGMLERIVADGPTSGIVVCATTDGSSPSVLATMTGQRWVHHLDDASIARAAGRRVALPRVPGRLCVVESGLVAQVVIDDDPLSGLPERGAGPPPIGVLPTVVDPDEVPETGGDDSIVVGLAATDLLPAALRVPEGDHVFVGGAAGTGKSTALWQLAASWSTNRPNGRVIVVDRSHPLDEVRTGGRREPLLVVVDDADRIDDASGELAAIVAGRRPGVTIIAAARVEAVRAAYGHWIRDVTRSRCGLILTSTGDVDGELLGATLPRRSIIPARPGLGWLIDAQGHRLVQVAARMPT